MTAAVAPTEATKPDQSTKALTAGAAGASGIGAIVMVIIAVRNGQDPTPYLGAASAFAGSTALAVGGYVWHHNTVVRADATKAEAKYHELAARLTLAEGRLDKAEPAIEAAASAAEDAAAVGDPALADRVTSLEDQVEGVESDADTRLKALEDTSSDHSAKVTQVVADVKDLTGKVEGDVKADTGPPSEPAPPEPAKPVVPDPAAAASGSTLPIGVSNPPPTGLEPHDPADTPGS